MLADRSFDTRGGLWAVIRAPGGWGVAVLGALGLAVLVLATTALTALDPWWGIAAAAAALVPPAIAFVLRFPAVAAGIWVVLSPWLMRSTEVELGAGIPNLNFETAGIYAISLVFLLRLATRCQSVLPLTALDRAALIYIGAMALSGVLMGRTPPETIRQVLLENGYPFALYFSMKHLVRRPRDVRTLALFLLVAAVALSAHAIADQALGLKLGKVARDEITTNAQLARLGGYHNLQANRAGGPLGNSITLGVSLIQGAVIAFLLLLLGRSLLDRGVALALTLASWVALMVTYTRSIYIASALCVPLMWAWYPRLRRHIVRGAGLAVVAALLYLPLAAMQPENRLTRTGSINERMGAYVNSYFFIKASPIIGHGYGYLTYPHLRSENVAGRVDFVSRRDQLVNNTPHSEILRILITMGVVGLALYVRFLWALFRELQSFQRALPALGLERMRPYVVIAGCGMIAFYGQSLFTDLTAMGYADTIVYLFLGAVLGVYEHARLGPEPPDVSGGGGGVRGGPSTSA